MRTTIVNIGHFGTESADINRKFRQELFAAESIKHRKYLLRFAQCENGNQNAPAARENFIDCFGQAAFLSGARPICRFGVIAPRAFHDQDINLFFGKDRCFHDRLIVKIDVARVKNGAAFGSQQDSSRAEDVPRIEEFECQCICFVMRRAFAGNREALPHRTPMPKLRSAIDFTM